MAKMRCIGEEMAKARKASAWPEGEGEGVAGCGVIRRLGKLAKMKTGSASRMLFGIAKAAKNRRKRDVSQKKRRSRLFANHDILLLTPETMKPSLEMTLILNETRGKPATSWKPGLLLPAISSSAEEKYTSHWNAIYPWRREKREIKFWPRRERSWSIWENSSAIISSWSWNLYFWHIYEENADRSYVSCLLWSMYMTDIPYLILSWYRRKRIQKWQSCYRPVL